MQQLESERLILRPWRIEDAPDMFAYARNPDVGPNAGWAVHQSVEDSKKIIESFISRGDTWAIERRDAPGVIGSFGAHRDPKRDDATVRMIGYVLAREQWGHGYMTEAAKRVLAHLFVDLWVPLVSVYHYDFNARSRRVIEKCGFSPEGRLRRASVLPDGSVCDDMCYSMTREEYLARYE